MLLLAVERRYHGRGVANLAVFPRICVFFKTCGLLVFGLVLIKICLFLGLFLQISVLLFAFFSNFMALLLFQFTA